MSLKLSYDRTWTKQGKAAFTLGPHSPTQQWLCTTEPNPAQRNACEPGPLPCCSLASLPTTHMHPCQAQHSQWIWCCKQNGQLAAGGMGKKKPRRERKVFQLLMIFSLPRGKQNPQRHHSLENCCFYLCCSTKLLGVVPTVPWHKTTGGWGSCFCWEQNREAIYFGCISVQWVMFRLENWPQLSCRSLLPAKLACYPIPPSSLSAPPPPSLARAAFILLKPPFNNSHCATLTLRVREKGQWRA